MNGHLMIDLETMGGTPDGVIAQIAYSIFDPKTGMWYAEGAYNVSFTSCVEAGLSYHEDTIRWWLEQGPEARAGLRGDDGMFPVSLSVALDALDKVYRDPPERSWAFPASFDFAILEAAYRGLNRKVPWDYRTLRCARTYIAASGMTKEDMPKICTAHIASADCRNQIRWLMEARSRIDKPLM